MARVRVFELAKKLKLTSKELLDKLRAAGIEVKSHMSGVDETQVQKALSAAKKPRKKKAVKTKAKPTRKKTAVSKKKAAPAKTRAKTVSKKSKQDETVAVAVAEPETATAPTIEEIEPEKVRGITVASDGTIISVGKARKTTKEPKRSGSGVAVAEAPAKDRAAAGAAPEALTAEEEGQTLVAETERVIEIDEVVTVEELAKKLDVETNDLILEMMDQDILATKNQILDVAVARQIASTHGCEIRVMTMEEDLFVDDEEFDPSKLEPRAPVVTVMGHVDHGKTSLLDVVRKTDVVGGESGGITQHIGASKVELPHGQIVFLDTPGHEAFTAMRARGAKVTDLVVLVVAADDGVKPQTVEAVNHATDAEVPIIVAVNKIDRPNADPAKVRQELAKLELVTEEWGGKTVFVDVSAKTEDGIDDLLEMLLVQAEDLQLRANPARQARGVVLEGLLDRGRGPVGHILIQNGTLRKGDVFICGQHYGKVRALVDEHGKEIVEATPSTPVEVLGFSGVPEPGDIFICVGDEKKVRQISESRQEKQRERMAAPIQHKTLEDLQQQIAEGEVAQLKLIVKADVQGSVDALVASLEKIKSDEVRLDVIHQGVGGVNRSDVMLASAADAIVIGYHVTASADVSRLAEKEAVEIRNYSVIYKAIDDIRAAMEGMLAPKYRQEVTARAEVRQVFRISSIGAVAGCFVLEGKITRGQNARVIRDDVIVYESRIEGLRRFKDDVRDVASGFECGIKMQNFDDTKEGDIIEAYTMIELERRL